VKFSQKKAQLKKNSKDPDKCFEIGESETGENASLPLGEMPLHISVSSLYAGRGFRGLEIKITIIPAFKWELAISY